MKTRFITFHNGNLNPALVEGQKAVFDALDIPLEQFMHPIFAHGQAIDNFLANEPWEEIVLWDVDCIPLNREFLKFTGGMNYLFGAQQKAGHIKDSQIYVGPCFMVLNHRIFETIGRPSFLPTVRGDVAEEISYGCRQARIPIHYLTPTHVEKPMWDLSPGVKFGYGTTYGNMVYHAFESNANHESTVNFIKKCQEVIQLHERKKIPEKWQ